MAEIRDSQNPASASPKAPVTAAERMANPRPHPHFKAFCATISALRAPDGCPWDREQTHESIAHNMPTRRLMPSSRATSRICARS